MPLREETMTRIHTRLDEWNRELEKLEGQARSQQALEYLEMFRSDLERVLADTERAMEHLRRDCTGDIEEMCLQLDQGWQRVSRDMQNLCDQIYPGN